MEAHTLAFKGTGESLHSSQLKSGVGRFDRENELRTNCLLSW
jgi:hypothetical protein